MIDQLEREKELQESVSQSARDRMEHMRFSIEDLKNKNINLKEKCDSQLDQINASKSEITEMNHLMETMKLDYQAKEERLLKEKLELTESSTQEKAQYQAELLRRVEEMQTLSNEKKKLRNEVESACDEVSRVKESIKQNELSCAADKRAMIERHAEEKEDLTNNYEHQIRIVNAKLAKISDENERLHEEVTRLKSNSMNDKLRFEEESLSQRAKWKQEEMAKTKQYEDRIDLILQGKDELQTKVSKLSVEIAETQAQLTASQKECEATKRQCEQLQQLMNQRDLEHRNESNRAKLEVDSERRVNAELKDKVASQEIKIQEIRSQMKDMQTEKDSEKARLQEQIRLKDDELKRGREEELRRAGMLETALQSYISSTRSSYK